MVATALRRAVLTVLLALCWTDALSAARGEQTLESVTLRGHSQTLHIYGTRGGPPVIVSSGDGGWVHLGPRVAELLAQHGYFVVGFDIKAYLEGFTAGSTTLSQEDVRADYKALVDFAGRGSKAKPILIGVSEGAGLSVLAASDERSKGAIAGVIGLGLCDRTALGWRWTDDVIYITHGTPNEPTFSTAAIVDRMAPVPLAAIHSTHDEFVPLAEIQHVLDRAREPKRLWVVNAANHRFSNNEVEFDRCLFEAIDWIARTAR
jgi:dienelactone hydrolase